ncbi:hypothetical protein ACFVTY_02225 [Streptomyces sp. NPDC058067]
MARHDPTELAKTAALATQVATGSGLIDLIAETVAANLADRLAQ